MASEKRESYSKENNPETDTSDFISVKKPYQGEKDKKIDLNELYLKKYAHKVQNREISLFENDRCKTPMANCNKILNNKLISPILSGPEKRNNPYKKIPSNCLTYVDRKKEMKYMDEVDENLEFKSNNNTLDINNNNYIY